MERKIRSILVGTLCAVVAIAGFAEGKAEGKAQVKDLRFTCLADNSAMFKEMAAAFEAKNPGIKITVDIAGDQVQYKETAPQLFAAQEKPDVAWYWAEPQSGYSIMLKAGILEPLDDIYAELGLEKNVAPSAVKFAKTFGHSDGKFYAVATDGVYFPVIYYNKKIFKDAGIAAPEGKAPTLEEFNAMAAKLKAKDFAPITAGLMEGWIVGHLRDVIFQRQIPENKLDDLKYNWQPGSQPKYAFTDPDVTAAHRTLKDLMVNVYAEGALSRSYGEGRSLFIQGKAAMYQDGSWGASSIKAEAPADFEFGWFLFPKTRADIEPKMLAYYGDAVMIPKGGKNVAEAKQFVKFIMSKEGQTIVAKNKFLPARIDLDTSVVTAALGYPVADMVAAAAKIGTDDGWDAMVPAKAVNLSFTALQDMAVGRAAVETVGVAMEKNASDLRTGK